jgi:hypothetical protein
LKKPSALISGLMLIVGVADIAIAGNLDSTGSPSAGSGMYSLAQIYDYINSGTVLPTPGPFQEPIAAPGSTMKTTTEIGDALKSLLERCDITSANVEQGKTFFCTQPGSWGLQSGTAQLVPTPTPTSTPTPTITPIPWDQSACESYGGYWATLGDDVSGYGCWFDPHNTVESCTETCARINSALACDPRNWNDSTTCSVCRHFVASTNGRDRCDAMLFDGEPHYDNRGYQDCGYRSANISQNCDGRPTFEGPIGSGPYTRLCVCRLAQ